MTILGVGLTIHATDALFTDFGQAIDEAKALGAAFVELPLHDLDIVVGGRIRRDRLDALAGTIRDRGVACTLHGHLGINLMEDPHLIGLHCDLLTVNIEIAQALGCIHLVIHTGHCRPQQGAGIERAYERQREALARFGAEAKKAGVVLCVENVFNHDGQRHTASPGRLAAELAAIDHQNVRATFDFSHGALHCAELGLDFMSEARALAPFAKHLHLHDSFGRPKDFWTYTLTEDLAFGVGDLHLPLGWGSIPWDALARECVFPEGVVANIELNRRWWAEARGTVATAKAFGKIIGRARLNAAH